MFANLHVTVKHAETFATKQLESFPKEFYFHNLQHTKFVAQSCNEIDDQRHMTMIAAWFHDLGYLQGSEKHEERSCEIAEHFLDEQKFIDSVIREISDVIMATKLPHHPRDLKGMILADADLAHLAADDFIEWSLALRNEFASLKNQHFKTDTDWWKFNIAFLEKHEYHTEYGKRVLQPKKMKNISVLQKLC